MKTGLRLFFSRRGRSAAILGFLAVIGLVTSVTPASAVPASQRPVIAQQPDGRQFLIRRQGDEWSNWVETEAGYTIDQDAQGVWQYVTGYQPPPVADGVVTDATATEEPVLSGVDATEPPPAGILPHLQPASTRPVSPTSSLVAAEVLPDAIPVAGSAVVNRKLLLILAEFNNQTGSTAQPSWATGYIGGIADYYAKMSFGQVVIQPALEDDSTLPDSEGRILPAANNGVIGWVNVSSELSALETYLGMSDTTGNHPNVGDNKTRVQFNRLVARAAMTVATPYIQWSLYDTDADGWVTADELAVIVVVAGYEVTAVDYTAAPSVWAHAWDLDPALDGGELRLDNKVLGVGKWRSGIGPLQVTSGYSMFGEKGLAGGVEYQLPFGIALHELGHALFGLPDLYEVNAAATCPDGSRNQALGAWSLMAAGSAGSKWGAGEREGSTPVPLDAWSRLVLGWVTPIAPRERVELTALGAVGATVGNTVYKAVTNGLPTEYFLIENRQNSGFDQGLQKWLSTSFSGGVLVYHIDDSIPCTNNECNSRIGNPHPRVHLETGGRACISNNLARDDDVYRKGSKGSETVFMSKISVPSNSLLWLPDSPLKGAASGVTIREISAAGPVMRVRSLKY